MSRWDNRTHTDDLSRAMTLEKDALGMELVRELLPQRVRLFPQAMAAGWANVGSRRW